MLKKLSSRRSEKAGTFAKSATALFVLQLASYAFPLLLIPYLTRLLGVELYGVVAFGLSITQVACVITDYGFNLSATYQIARNHEDKRRINEIIGAVFLCKAMLFLVLSLLLAIYIETQTKYAAYETYLWLMLIPIAGQTLQPFWFFQGMEKMLGITIYTLIAKSTYLVLVLLLVRSAGDYVLIGIANGAAQLLAAAIGITMMYRAGCRPRWSGWRFVMKTFNDSTSFFWSRAAVSTYSMGGTFFLGLVSSPLQVAYYSSAEQLYRAAQALLSPISQALYPYMAKRRDFPLFFRLFKWLTVLNTAGVIVVVISASWLIQLLYGAGFLPMRITFIMFALTFLISLPSALLGYPFLGALGNNRMANLSVIYAGITQATLLIICYLAHLTRSNEIVLTVFFVEALVLIIRIVFARKTYIQYNIDSPPRNILV